jgi:TPP-dependent indolepyruvate ferredoxin oxidoreductase alpha subunit
MTIIAHPKNKKQEVAIEAVLKALNISFIKEDESPYNSEFVAEVKQSLAEVKKGNYITLDSSKSLWENLK